LILAPVFKTLTYLPRFIGIFLAVCALKSFGIVRDLAGFLSNTLKNDFFIGIALGLL
jgi:Na+/H+ antiporter NhaD/arsenite permease-like protein